MIRRQNIRTIIVAIALVISCVPSGATSRRVEYSTAGFHTIPDAPRTVSSMNPAWRFAQGTHPEASAPDFDDSQWTVVNLPDGLELLPVDASGGVNYRGPAWYRKHFTPDPTTAGKRQMLYFEAIMGKSSVWVNGVKVVDHFGGFLPIAIDITDQLKYGIDNVIAVMADNSDDPDFPPGKPQATLDYCYFGGIYRDVWLVTTDKLHITDPNQSGRMAGGGLLIGHPILSKKGAELETKIEIANQLATTFKGKIEYTLRAPDSTIALRQSLNFGVAAGSKEEFKSIFNIKNPQLWTPWKPDLYSLEVRITNTRGMVVDGYRQLVGLRTIEFNPRQGLVLNGIPYPRRLIGANRHQDFAVVGNALSNTLHQRDVMKLRDAGMEVVRNAHYPQDPAFMDACDQLGMFVIVNTPGWQFWNDKPIFGERVYDDVRQMVRRDRNRPSVIMWEPILNETWYPANFAADVHQIVKEEYPYAGGNYTASDSEAKGAENFDIQFSHPAVGDKEHSASHIDTTKTYFTREWGDNVDDWNSHNSSSRVLRKWGEVPQLIQAAHYAKSDYPFTNYDALYRAPVSHFGGTLWHSFDHQRGYHPDPFYGGIMDAFRRPKYSYEMFRSQATYQEPMVFIANELSPFSPTDVTVYSNCDTVLLHTFVGDTLRTYTKSVTDGMPSPIITFEGAWDFMKDKALSRANRQKEAFLLAEAIKDGQVVASHRRSMARRPVQLTLEADTQGVPLTADGSDMVVLVASMTDHLGEVKKLNNQSVIFEVEGPAQLLLPPGIEAVPIEWGEAVVMLRTTLTPGEITIRAHLAAEGDNTAKSATLRLRSIATPLPLSFSATEAAALRNIKSQKTSSNTKITEEQRTEIERQLRAVEAQQEAFGEQTK